MVLMGLPCCLASGFAGDSPNTKVGLAFWLMVRLMLGTGPVGFASVFWSDRMARMRGWRWLWLNSIVFVAHFSAIWLLAKWVMR